MCSRCKINKYDNIVNQIDEIIFKVISSIPLEISNLRFKHDISNG